MSNTDRSARTRTGQLHCRPCCPPSPFPPPTGWSRYPAIQNVNMGCHRLVDVSGLYFCDGSYINSTDNIFQINSTSTLVLRGTADLSGDYNSASIVSADRIYQELNPDPSWNSVSGYYALAKDVAPALNPYSSGAKAVAAWISYTNTGGNWHGVCWSPELSRFVAVARSGNRTAISSDGRIWTNIVSSITPTGTSANRVIWCKKNNSSDGIFVLVAIGVSTNPLDLGNNIATSPDGISWTVRNSGIQRGPFDVAWSPELETMVAVSSDPSGSLSTLCYSTDVGTTWTGVLSVTAGYLGITWSPELGLFCAVGTTHTATSLDGINWIQTPLANLSNSFRSVTWSPELGIFVASAVVLGQSSAYSFDGTTWNYVSTPATFDGTTNIRYVLWIAELEIFVSVASGGTNRVMWSPNGVNWFATTSPAPLTFRQICYSPELGVIVGATLSATIFMSSLIGRPPTSYNVFDNSFNSIDQSGNWTIQQVLKSGTYTTGQTTPSVAGMNLLSITNSVSTTITNFTGGATNQELTIVFPGATPNTIIQNNTSIRLQGPIGTNYTATQYDTLTLLFTGSVWVELSRSFNV